MRWLLPAKTFLLGEYAALTGGSAILLTTAPCFELSLTEEKGLFGIHPQAPAGLWWAQNQPTESGLVWSDPYQGLGGLGASSAQFIATYLALCQLEQRRPALDELLEAYERVSWSGKGSKPSAYDVRAQVQGGCVYLNKNKNLLQTYSWPFQELSFILVHTGVKVATHQHLEVLNLPESLLHLSEIVDEAKAAFDTQNSLQLIQAVKHYHKALNQHQLVAEHSLALMNELQKRPEILAMKGCGALGADILLLLCPREELQTLAEYLLIQNQKILATEKKLTPPKSILDN